MVNAALISVRENLARETKLMTDESSIYTKVGAEFASHHTVNHRDNVYVRDTNIRSLPAGSWRRG